MRFMSTASLLVVLSGINTAGAQTRQPDVTKTVTTTGGDVGKIPYFNGASTILPSTLYFNANGLGIGKPPGAALDVSGKSIVRGILDLARTADATSAKGINSSALIFHASAFDSSNSSIQAPNFQLQAEPTGNNTSTTGATFNFLYGSKETGLYVSPNGTIHFSPAQTFPIAAGPAGPQGATGAQGPPGPAGPQGPAGSSNSLTFPYSGGLSDNCDCGSCGDCTTLVDAFTIFNQGDGGAGIVGMGASQVSLRAGKAGAGVVGYGGQAIDANGNPGGFGVAAYGGPGTDDTTDDQPSSGGAGIYAQGGAAIRSGDSPGPAAEFVGGVSSTGMLSVASSSFKIDNPIDPANKYLSHSSVESPDMMNIYNGNVTTDGKGEAVVILPDYFESLNRDFRYQLTVIGQPAQAYVASEIVGSVFVVKTDRPGVKVSWQVTGIRQDAWANAHRVSTEELKIAGERGRYLHPELFGHKGELAIHERPRSTADLRVSPPVSPR